MPRAHSPLIDKAETETLKRQHLLNQMDTFWILRTDWEARTRQVACGL